jgi:hypothetical protein
MNTLSSLSTALVNNSMKAIESSNDFGFKLDIQLRQCVAGEKFTESGQ